MTSVALSKTARMLHKPWYLFWRLVEEHIFRGHNYNLHIPYGHRVYTPWYDESPESDFGTILKKIRASGPLAVSADRCHILFQFARRAVHFGGDMAECGVYTGGTAHLIASILCSQHKNKTLHLFDTFCGMPSTSDPKRDYHSPEDFAGTSLNFVQNRLREFKACCVFHPGLIPDTFSEVTDVSQYAFVHVDVDIYPSAMDCCTWFWPRMSPGGVIIFDDYGFYPYRNAAKAAVDEFFADQIDKPIVLPTGQAIVFKT